LTTWKDYKPGPFRRIGPGAARLSGVLFQEKTFFGAKTSPFYFKNIPEGKSYFRSISRSHFVLIRKRMMRRSCKTFLSALLLVFLGWGPLVLSPARGQTITTVAGSGPSTLANWYSGDGGPATQAQFSTPDDLAFDSQGNLYIADANNCVVRKVSAGTSLISTFAGSYTVAGGVTTGDCGYSGDGGPAVAAELNYPAGLAVDSNNNLYIGDYYNSVVREVFAAGGGITTVVGNGTAGYSGDGGPALSAELWGPYGLTFDTGGNLYVADSANNVIRKISAGTSIISTVAGMGVTGWTGDGGPATLATLNAPQRLAFDAAGDLYIADPGNFAVRKVAVGTNLISTVAGSGVSGVASGNGGPATQSTNSGPDGIVIGCDGNLFMTDDINHVIREVYGSPGTIVTVAGTGTAGYTASGPALSAEIVHPEALAFFQGNLYDVDYGNGVAQVIMGLCTPSLTPTPTNSATSTPTHTATFTLTPSFTPSYTETPTPSLTPTNSPTITLTPTYTPTSTPTPSSTSSPTWTTSSTPSVTPTATLGLSMGKQVSEPQAKSGDMLTYTLGVTLVGTTLNNVVVTDTLPANVGFVSVGTPSAGNAVFHSNSSQISWTLPAALAPGIYTLSYQTQVDPFTPGGTNIVNGAQLTFPGCANPLTSSVTVQVTGQYTVSVDVYNEAGELVDQVRSLQLSQSVNSLNLEGNAITSLTGAGGQINIYSQGYLLGAWNGTGSDGNPVSNGVYFIKVNSVDPYGVVNTVTRQATVSRSLAKISVNVYNEAGEVVKHLFGWVDDPMGAQMTSIVLSGSALQPGIPAGQGQPSNVRIMIQTSGAAVTLSWDGTNDNGSYVSAGYYLLEAHWDDGQGGTTDISKGLLVTANGIRNDGTLVAQPNILKLSTGVNRTTFKYDSSQNLTLSVRIYTLAGELVFDLQGASGTNQASWDATGYASGLYLAAVDLLNPNGGQMGQQVLKVMVLR
jgi:uncharacterized repeat protein (TIGR01451 family)